jgi:hypothetical protein
MALVVLLRGVNVGGHRAFRPTMLAAQLKHLDVVNIGAAGTFVIRKPVTLAKLRADLARRLPFDTETMICHGRDIVRLMSQHPFVLQPERPDIVGFVSVLSGRPHSEPPIPLSLPSKDKWLFEKLGWENAWDWGTPAHFGGVCSGECEIPDGDDSAEKGVWMSIWVDDVDAVHQRCLQQSLDVTWPPTDMPWNVREMHVRHPDGHVFRISRGIEETE